MLDQIGVDLQGVLILQKGEVGIEKPGDLDVGDALVYEFPEKGEVEETDVVEEEGVGLSVGEGKKRASPLLTEKGEALLVDNERQRRCH
ncbi:MAG: hypothetical protein BWY86_01079 [Candidatus Aminicenantes bacterium ADurb.Bin508]|nr:MAG: hypothetical protein BWY86_01079 [Candidatus Aminicenantes bacterium ADurb.Bin508]